jgi:hypothetical protein
MPSRMQKEQDRRAAKGPIKDSLDDLYTFKPKIGELVTAEMFKEK